MTPAELLSAFTWRDALDFGLLFLVSYGLLRMLRGTRALPVLIAVVALGLLAWVVGALDLIGVASLLRYFFEYLIIILIVVFRQELRRLLLAFGQRLLPAGRRHATRSAIGELVSALERLHRSRIGAMVILQGTIDVLEVASDGGIEVDAPLRANTLVALAIPHPANVAHDGAVLVNGFRIDRAGVICPLTRRKDLDPRFGTRHRGAIGISEETDALVVVVSEERGELRIAERGSLSDPLDPETVGERVTAWIDELRADHLPSQSGVHAAAVADAEPVEEVQ